MENLYFTDDIADSAGTLCNAAEALKKKQKKFIHILFMEYYQAKL